MIVYEGKMEDGNLLRIEAVSARTFRVRIADEWEKESAMNRYGFVLEQPAPEYSVQQQGDSLTVTTACASLTVSTVDGSVTLSNEKGEVIFGSARPPVNSRLGFSAAFNSY